MSQNATDGSRSCDPASPGDESEQNNPSADAEAENHSHEEPGRDRSGSEQTTHDHNSEQSGDSDDPLTADVSGSDHAQIAGETFYNWKDGRNISLTLDHVRGYPEVRDRLHNLLVDPVQADHNLYDRFKVSPPNFLFKGDSGTGKTHAAKCVVGSLGVPYVYLSPGELMSQYVNRSGRMIRKLFYEAESLADSFGYVIIVVDELDAVLPSRSDSDGHNEDLKVVNQFLTELQSTNERDIIFIGATNYPDRLDEAATRNGRVDETLTFSLPDVDGRFEILRYHLNDRPHSIPDRQLQDFATRVGATTPAKLKALVDDAAREAARKQYRELRIDHLVNQTDSV